MEELEFMYGRYLQVLAASKRCGLSAGEVGEGLKSRHKNQRVVKYYTGPWTATGPVE